MVLSKILNILIRSFVGIIFAYKIIKIFYNRQKISMETFLFIPYRIGLLYIRITIIMVGILISLMFLHGEHYPQCKCIYPDEIMDLQCSFSFHPSVDEKTICSEIRKDKKNLTFGEIQILSHISGATQKKLDFSPEIIFVDDTPKRLFSLQRYKS